MGDTSLWWLENCENPNSAINHNLTEYNPSWVWHENDSANTTITHPPTTETQRLSCYLPEFDQTVTVVFCDGI